jgi:hypothetical protein
MRLSFTARTPGVTSAACTHRSMMALGSICGFRRFQFFSLCVSALGAIYKSISDGGENPGCECDWAQADVIV